MTPKRTTSLALTLFCLSLSGCFTGIESTPKITGNDVKREKVTESQEQKFLADITGENPSEWKAGKRFYVTDDKISLLFGGSSNQEEPLKGKYITFSTMQDINSVTGTQVAELTFLTPQGREVSYRTDVSIEAHCKRGYLEIPFTIEQYVIDNVRSRLRGNTYYIITSMWYDLNDQSRTGRKFVPVTVTDVVPGTTVYPLRLVMDDEKGMPFHLFMSVGDNIKSPRGFASLFSFSDPHLKYPSVTPETWQNIVNGRVAEDMTRDECRLSLGNPAQIDRRPGYSYMREIWSYENGIYLIFEDGLLRSFRR